MTLISITLAVSPYLNYDPINLPKWSILVIGTTILGVLALSKKFETTTKKDTFINMNIFFIVIIVLATIASESDLLVQLIGRNGRNTGTITFVCLALISMVTYKVTNNNLLQKFTKLIVALGLIQICYGFLQFLGLEFLPYSNMNASNVIGTFGNANFMSAFLSFIAVFTFAGLLQNLKGIRTVQSALRVTLLLASLVLIQLSESTLGLFTFAISIVVYLNICSLSNRIYIKAMLIFDVGLFIISLIVLKFVGLWSTLIFNLQDRIYYWDAGLGILKNNLLGGVGIDAYGDWFRAYRSESAYESYVQNSQVISNSAHNLLIDLGVGGGLFLLASYLSIQFYVSYLIIVRLRQSASNDNQINPFIAVWIAFNVQSMVNVNQIGISIWGWILTGIIAKSLHLPSVRLPEKELLSTTRAKRDSIKLRLEGAYFFKVLIGFMFGIVICAGPLKADYNFMAALKARNAKQLMDATLTAPLDQTRMNISASIFSDNNLNEQAKEIVILSSLKFPRNYEAWRIYRLLESDKIKRDAIELEMLKLDPFNVDFK